MCCWGTPRWRRPARSRCPTPPGGRARRGGASVTEETIRRFAAVRLADFKVPAQVLIRDELPKGPTGKLQRMALAEALGLPAPGPRAGGGPGAFGPPRAAGGG